MASAQGAQAQMALACKTVYGTPPVSELRLTPFARTTLGVEQPLLESELLGYGRDPLARSRTRSQSTVRWWSRSMWKPSVSG
jgi:hypothetical protein